MFRNTVHQLIFWKDEWVEIYFCSFAKLVNSKQLWMLAPQSPGGWTENIFILFSFVKEKNENRVYFFFD